MAELAAGDGDGVPGTGLDDHGVLLEYQLPLTSRRLDCIVTGHDAGRSANAVIIELKQWTDVDGASVVGDKVVTWVGGGHRDVLHPSVQVGQYRQYLADNHEVFHADPSPIGLSACAYLHNYHLQRDDVILSEPFRPVLKDNPLFSADDVPGLCEFLASHLEAGDGSNWSATSRRAASAEQEAHGARGRGDRNAATVRSAFLPAFLNSTRSSTGR